MKPERDEIFYASVRKLFHVSQIALLGRFLRTVMYRALWTFRRYTNVDGKESHQH